MTQPIRLTEADTLVAVKAGDYVTWRASRGEARGKVVSVHTASKVPSVSHHVVGTEHVPAARVRVYAKSGNGWAPTDTYVPLTTDKLTPIDALPEATKEAVAGSFDDIRTQVAAAIEDRAEEFGATGEPSVWVQDIGLDWAVYSVDYGNDLYLVNYSIDAAGAVVIGDPQEVTQVTSYVPAQDAIDGPTGAPIQESDRLMGRLLAAKGTDASGGRIFHVQILTYGDSQNGRRYTEGVMRAALPLYEGAKAYDHHRTAEELTTSTLRGLVGTYRDVQATTNGLEADLHLLPGATHVAEALDQSLTNQGQGLPPMVGISHDVLAQYRPITAGGRRMVEATSIVKVHSADVVADPAAGGMATRMVAGGIEPPPPSTRKGPPVTFKEFLELLRACEAGRRPELLAQHADLVTASGLDADAIVRMAEALTPPAAPPPADPVHATEALLSPLVARLTINTALVEAGLPASLAESVLLEVGTAPLTEAAIVGKVAVYKRLNEGLEKVTTPGPSVKHHGGVKVTADEFDKKVKGLDAMLAGDYSGYRSLKEAFLDITGAGDRMRWSDTEDLNRRILRESATIMIDGERADYDSNLTRGTESVASSTWGNILGDSVTRRMVALYATPNLNTWRNVVSSVIPVNDFRTQRIERMGGYGTLPGVNQGAPYQPLTTPSNDGEVTYGITKRGGTEDLTLETIANDDLRAVQRIPQLLGIAAAQTLFRFVWELLSPTTNPNFASDATAVYHTNHANTATSALSGGALSTIRGKMRKQSGYGDTTFILGLTPAYLVVPPDLEEIAFEVCTSAVALPSGAPVGAATNIPNLHAGLNYIVVDYWSGQSATGWIAVADPNMCPTVEIGFYQGQDAPSLFVQQDPTVGSLYNADKITYKIRHIYGGNILDYRGFQRGNT